MADPLTPVHFKEGLFLRPHHLQEQGAHLERLLSFHLGVHSPYLYGVKSIEVDEGRLEEHEASAAEDPGARTGPGVAAQDLPRCPAVPGAGAQRLHERP